MRVVSTSTRYALTLNMLKKKKKISRAIDQQMSESKFCSDLQSHLSCILSFPYHPSHHLHLLPSFTRRLSASIKTIAQIFNHLTWTPTWLPPTAEPKQFIILLFQLRNAKCTRSETTVMFNTFFFSCFCCIVWLTWARIFTEKVRYLKSNGSVNETKF